MWYEFSISTPNERMDYMDYMVAFEVMVPVGLV